MIRRPPRSTRTDTLCPSTTPFRSPVLKPIFSCSTTAPPMRGGLGLPRPSSLTRSEEHTSELQSLMRISYAVFCLKKKKYEEQRTSSATNNYHTARNPSDARQPSRKQHPCISLNQNNQ